MGGGQWFVDDVESDADSGAVMLLVCSQACPRLTAGAGRT